MPTNLTYTGSGSLALSGAGAFQSSGYVYAGAGSVAVSGTGLFAAFYGHARLDQDVTLVGIAVTSNIRSAQDLTLAAVLPSAPSIRVDEELVLAAALPSTSLARLSQEVVLVAVGRFKQNNVWISD
jgi:hypothetical protein